VMVLALGAIALRLARQMRRQAPGPDGVAAGVSRELTRLDPFTFKVLPGDRYGAEHVVVGATGTFVIVAGHASIDGQLARDVAGARRAANRVRRSAGSTAVHTSVHALLCLPGRQFPPRTRRGVRIIPWGSVVSEVADRSRSVTLHQSKRVAERLGTA